MENLRGAAERLIVEPYKTRLVRDKINIIAAPTGVGKTYSIMNHLIPHDIENGYNKFIVLTVFRDNVYQDSRAYQEALFGKAIVTENISHFLSYRGNIPIVFISTIAGSTLGGSKTYVEQQNDMMLLEFIKMNRSKIALFWDEAHFGGSSNKKTFPINTGRGPSEASSYNATYYTFIESALTAGCKVTGLTATPTFEQQEMLQHISNGFYHFLTDVKDWPTMNERTEIGSQHRDITFYDADIDFSFSLTRGLIDFYSFSESFANRAKIINDLVPAIGALKKPVLLIATGRDGTKSGYEIMNTLDTVLSYYRGKVDENAFFVGTATQDGYYVYNLKNESKRLSQDQFFTSISDDDSNLNIVLFIEKFKFGLNLSNVTHEIHMRERNSIMDAGYGRVTVPVIQTYGRAVRTWFGIKNNDFNSVFVSDAVEYLNRFYGYKIYDVLREHMLNANSHTFHVPDNLLFRQSVDQWKDRYAAPISLSQFQKKDEMSITSTLPIFKEQTLDVCPTCKRPFDDHQLSLDHETFSNTLGIAA